MKSKRGNVMDTNEATVFVSTVERLTSRKVIGTLECVPPCAKHLGCPDSISVAVTDDGQAHWQGCGKDCPKPCQFYQAKM